MGGRRWRRRLFSRLQRPWCSVTSSAFDAIDPGEKRSFLLPRPSRSRPPPPRSRAPLPVSSLIDPFSLLPFDRPLPGFSPRQSASIQRNQQICLLKQHTMKLLLYPRSDSIRC
ncbi:unnamed protein product [Linum trigynum]|uniref:Uncharacterized protein n=1 Tax=Linum trigynum TaxID=586398 RepID=A0AAV2CX66_9ROSI